jgi:hypothetical protein
MKLNWTAFKILYIQRNASQMDEKVTPKSFALSSRQF